MSKIESLLNKNAEQRDIDANFCVEDIRKLLKKQKKITLKVFQTAMQHRQVTELASLKDCMAVYQELYRFCSDLDQGRVPTLVTQYHDPEFQAEGWELGEGGGPSPELEQMRLEIKNMLQSPFLVKDDIKNFAKMETADVHAFLVKTIAERSADAARGTLVEEVEEETTVQVTDDIQAIMRQAHVTALKFPDKVSAEQLEAARTAAKDDPTLLAEAGVVEQEQKTEDEEVTEEGQELFNEEQVQNGSLRQVTVKGWRVIHGKPIPKAIRATVELNETAEQVMARLRDKCRTFWNTYAAGDCAASVYAEHGQSKEDFVKKSGVTPGKGDASNEPFLDGRPLQEEPCHAVSNVETKNTLLSTTASNDTPSSAPPAAVPASSNPEENPSSEPKRRRSRSPAKLSTSPTTTTGPITQESQGVAAVQSASPSESIGSGGLSGNGNSSTTAPSGGTTTSPPMSFPSSTPTSYPSSEQSAPDTKLLDVVLYEAFSKMSLDELLYRREDLIEQVNVINHVLSQKRADVEAKKAALRAQLEALEALG